jgi:hypothetical protein
MDGFETLDFFTGAFVVGEAGEGEAAGGAGEGFNAGGAGSETH